jgi:hypothetical protein
MCEKFVALHDRIYLLRMSDTFDRINVTNLFYGNDDTERMVRRGRRGGETRGHVEAIYAPLRKRLAKRLGIQRRTLGCMAVALAAPSAALLSPNNMRLLAIQ